MSKYTNSNAELLVIGAGQMRTGTNSLKVALEYLYKDKCYHMFEVFEHMEHVELWQKCVDNQRMAGDLANKIFNGYIATVDYPAAAFYRDMMELYPNSKIILSVREPDEWVRSVRDTTLPNQLNCSLLKIILYLDGTHKLIHMLHSTLEFAYQRSMAELNNDDVLKASFIRYNEEVKMNVPEDRLLIFEAREGWEPLCKFLDKDIPDIPYPKFNSTADFKYMFRKKMLRNVSKVLIPILIVGLGVLYLKVK